MAENFDIKDFQLPEELLEAVSGGAFEVNTEEQLRSVIRFMKNGGAQYESIEKQVTLLEGLGVVSWNAYTRDEVVEYMKNHWDEA